MIRLTFLGKIFGVILILLYVASLTSQSGLLLFLIGLLLGCFFINIFAARASVGAIHIRVPPTIQVGEGEWLAEPWDIINDTAKAAHNIELRNGEGAILRLSALAPKGKIGLVPNVLFSRRGVFPHSELKIVSSEPFGLVETGRQAMVPGEIVVYPAIYPCAEPRSRGFDAMVGGKHKGSRRSTMGSSFAGVRPFQAGDPFKQIHWQSSAKGLDLMVKTFDEELSGRVGIVLDTSPADRLVFDAAVRAAGSLVFAALDAGHHIEWLDLKNLEPLIIPPFADSAEILDRLARVTMGDRAIEAWELSDAVKRLSRRSALHIVFARQAGLSPLIEALIVEGRALSLYFPHSDLCPIGGKPRPEIPGDTEILRYTNSEIVAE